jgi:hypothetical protein
MRFNAWLKEACPEPKSCELCIREPGTPGKEIAIRIACELTDEELKRLFWKRRDDF